MPSLLLGPMLRHVDDTSATIWVDTDAGATVTVSAGDHRVSGATWSVHGHHFAILVLQGLAPATTTEYAVHLDDARVWPPADTEFAGYPPSVITTTSPSAQLRLAFGSCRRSEPLDAAGDDAVGPDALVAMAARMVADRERTGGAWPDLLLMVGDQLYADEPSAGVTERLEHSRRAPRERGSGAQDVAAEICTFEEYTWLYHESWRQVPVRWLLSTVPTCMLLDDHDLRDDWNTSLAWREDFSAKPWFTDRVKGAFGSYWVYQHLGNAAPADLAADPLLAAITAAPDEATASRLLDDFAVRADADPDSARWSYVRDVGAVRLLAIDNRCSRRLDPDRRAILDDAEWQWVREHALGSAARPSTGGGGVDHLLIACTLPIFMVPAFSDVEGWNEAVVAGAWGSPLSRVGEALRRAVDLEHWAAFRQSLRAVITLIGEVASAPQPPASVLVLSGDVHCSYTSRVQLDVDHRRTAIHQLVMSPFRNPLKPALKVANRLAGAAPVKALARALAASAGVARPKATWDVDAGPWFDNGVMTVVIDGTSACMEVTHVRLDHEGQLHERTTTRQLTP